MRKLKVIHGRWAASSGEIKRRKKEKKKRHIVRSRRERALDLVTG